MARLAYPDPEAMKRSVLALGVAALAAVGLGLWFAMSRSAPPPPPSIALWYWHTPFEIEEPQALLDAGVRDVFVRAATLSADDGHLILTRLQRYAASPDPLRVHAVVRLEPSVRTALDRPAEIAEKAAEAFGTARQAAQAAGVLLDGLQLDFDCPTSRLGDYVAVLERVRRALPDGTALSITALPAWVGAPSMRSLGRAVDFVCPQFYEGNVGTNLDDGRPIASPGKLAARMRAWDRLGVPFYAGLPSYGQAFLYDEKGALSGVYRGLDPASALRHPSFETEECYPVDEHGDAAVGERATGEQVVRLRAIRPTLGGQGVGYRLLYRLPTTASLRRQVEIARSTPARHLRGIAVFRYPEASETMTVPRESLLAVLRGEPTDLDVRLSAVVEEDKLARIEAPPGDTSEPVLVRLAVTNHGLAGSLVAADALVVTIRLGAPIPEFRSDFDSSEWIAEAGSRSSRMRATGARMVRASLAPGETARIGPLRIERRNLTEFRWRAVVRDWRGERHDIDGPELELR